MNFKLRISPAFCNEITKSEFWPTDKSASVNKNYKKEDVLIQN